MKCYIIVLKQIDQSIKTANDCIEAANRFGINPEIKEGVLGYNSKPLFEQYGITRFLTKDMLEFPGHQGCFLSHFELWKRCVEINEPIMILEHDGFMVRELPEDILERFEEVLYLDTFNACGNQDVYKSKVKDSLNNQVEVWNRPATNKTHGVGEFIWGAYGYLIKPKAAEKLINFEIDVGAAPTDVHIGRNIVDIKSTTVTVVSLHEYYCDGKLKEKSSTIGLSNFIEGKNEMCNTKFVTSNMCEELLKTRNK